ncbi:MBL fold metallo-hydrolase [Gordonia liuliyuniae]|uniref:MBL fold metallo-hydrolase n=1 Tax=Gordonia liuliyuniae TaxID=2911517 RepID=A0ABS9IR67_9ACTN|nr:MBL fold metallo-hydrolase [Gordonia liuliyuniae]MCF8588026.1 MBL fold metallo-hydrolase [Gordonia liuliyuniae]
MLIAGFPAGAFQTNCYLVASAPGSDAVVIDPGQDAAPQVRAALAEYSLTPVAVFLTHGHLDHTWNAQELADEFSMPVYIHADDRPMLTDPGMGIGSALSSMIGDLEFVEPEKVIEFVDGEDVDVAGLRWSVDHAPGHSRGSVLLTPDVPADPDTGETVSVCFSGDVLFNGSIGRTDLPGGSHQRLLDSIAAKLLPREDDQVILPGHGPQTTIGAERTGNPFLVDLPDIKKKGRFGL